MSFPLLQPASGGVDVTGAQVLIAFPSPDAGTSWVGTVNVPEADVGTSWTAYIGAQQASSLANRVLPLAQGTPVQSWGGTDVGGPFLITGGDCMVLVGTGITPGPTSLTAVFIGRIERVADLVDFPMPGAATKGTVITPSPLLTGAPGAPFLPVRQAQGAFTLLGGMGQWGVDNTGNSKLSIHYGGFQVATWVRPIAIKFSSPAGAAADVWIQPNTTPVAVGVGGLRVPKGGSLFDSVSDYSYMAVPNLTRTVVGGISEGAPVTLGVNVWL